VEGLFVSTETRYEEFKYMANCRKYVAKIKNGLKIFPQKVKERNCLSVGSMAVDSSNDFSTSGFDSSAGNVIKNQMFKPLQIQADPKATFVSG
jgi:hypothetical protein